MADMRRVNEILGSFHEWERPWEYIHKVLATPGIPNSEMQLIKDIWAEATDAEHWAGPGPKASHELVRQKLGSTYPSLDGHAVDSVIRAASYDWK